MFNIVIFGAPGCGKGTQSEQLINQYGLYHISTGEILRNNIAQKTPLGKIADVYIKQGQLIPDQLVIRMLEEVLDTTPEAKDGVIFDGFPRTVHQAEILDKILQKRGGKVDAVVGLEVEEQELIERILKRGRETGREDDNLETVKKRLDVYHSTTSPVIGYYTEKGSYQPIDGSGSVDDVFSQIKRHIDSKKK